MNKLRLKEKITTAKTLEGRNWIGKVVDTQDIDGNSRIKVEIDGLTEGIDKKDLPWYTTAQSFNPASNSQTSLPPVNARVKVGFPTDDIYNGIVEYSIASVPPGF
jgi:hypothetical protein